MLSTHQRNDAVAGLDEFFKEVTGDPYRFATQHLDSLQTIFASAGLIIGPLPKDPPTSGLTPEQRTAFLADLAAGKDLGPWLTGQKPTAAAGPTLAPRPTAPVVPGLLTPLERGTLNTAERAARSMSAKPGYVFKAKDMLKVVLIAKRVAGEEPLS